MTRAVLRCAAVYAAAVAVSHMVRAQLQPPPALEPDEAAVTVAAVGRRDEPPVRIVFRRVCPASVNAPPVLLIHGSPGSKLDLAGLVPTLARQRCVLVPDLPGFGDSTRHVPDYSFRSHGAYISAWLEQLGIARAHVLGFSMGSGVALSLVDLDPARVASLSMVSAIGVQELELFGNYTLNHVVHGVQLVGLWTLLEATPHMGWLDRTAFTLAYARNFFDSDQRPLRGVLRRVEVPTLILHGFGDALVPYEAALEHHRLVPQSELQAFDGGHFDVFERGPSIARAVEGFLNCVDAGRARTRKDADQVRMREAARPAPSSQPPMRGLPLYVAIAMLGGAVTLAALTLFAWRREGRKRPERAGHEIS